MSGDDVIRCPACRSGVLPLAGAGETSVRCGSCSTSHAVRDGVVDLIPTFYAPRSIGQVAMEWPPLVRIYEGRFWRRSAVMHGLLGLPFERERELVLRGLGLSGAEVVLDLACGPGLYTREIAREVPDGQVIGLDLSFPMLAYASRRAREEGLGNVRWVRGTAMDLPFADDRLDAVSCCAALHLFPDPLQALREILRVLRPGGRFAVAMIRRAESARGELTGRVSRTIGVAPLTEAGIQTRLLEAGFTDVTCHHARRLYMIWSARKAPATAPA